MRSADGNLQEVTVIRPQYGTRYCCGNYGYAAAAGAPLCDTWQQRRRSKFIRGIILLQLSVNTQQLAFGEVRCF
jgi:hypothetical protein